MEEYWLWLCSVPGLYCQQIHLLTTYFGNPKQVWEAPEQEFEIWRKKNIKWIDHLLDFRKEYSVDRVCHMIQQKGINFISWEQDGFPEGLKRLSDCPAGLFYRGRLPENGRTSVAIVGARQCSSYGRAMARELSGALAECGVQIISGLASGIDGCAQETAVDAGGSSFGILGCGVDICYPRDNFHIYRKLQEQGGILSEFPVGTPPMKHHFPLRNRIISGLADAVIVVEAREKSGSLITADLALEQGKDVYAVPGRNGDVLSYGCNRLISQGAGLVLSVDNLLEQLKIPERKISEKDNFAKKKQLGLAPEEKWVYSNLDLSPKSLEEISEKTDMPIGQLCGILLRLELQGMVTEMAKNQYVRLK